MHQCTVNGLKIGDGAPVRNHGGHQLQPRILFSKDHIVQARILASVPRKWLHRVLKSLISEHEAPHPSHPRSALPARRNEWWRPSRNLKGPGPLSLLTQCAPPFSEQCLKFDIHAINDINGLADPEYAKIAADSGLPCFLMASAVSTW